MSIALIASIIGIVAGAILLAGVFSSFSMIEHPSISDAEAARMPLDVMEFFTERKRGGDAIGGSHYFRMDEGFVDDENHCEFCIAMEYKPGPAGKASVAFTHTKPADLREASKLTFAARGDIGGEVLRIYAAGANSKSLEATEKGNPDRPKSDVIKGVTFAVHEEITLSKSWERYEIDLEDGDRSKVTHGFAFEILKGEGDKRQVVYIDSIFFTGEA